MQTPKDFTLKDADSLTLAKKIVATLIEKKALDVRLYSVKEESSITDYYVNASGRSSTQVASLADEVAFKTEESGRAPLRIEGREGNAWLLVDYGDVIVNVFDKPSREFYNFDRLLSEEGRVDISDIIAEIDKKFDITKAED
ncbi:MAG: ribosome silencing factor [Clostridia bacterium]|nr:ribosome silencing factor [Clostridia bacterium]